ncbi:hypothetical protein BGY98DRAFT_709542 [Russula aff. rugulosa BPL654]|nr:hypothetical protein BGY98DRAFT_709542 [Russula aff. rugulosa BPL654]
MNLCCVTCTVTVSCSCANVLLIGSRAIDSVIGGRRVIHVIGRCTFVNCELNPCGVAARLIPPLMYSVCTVSCLPLLPTDTVNCQYESDTHCHQRTIFQTFEIAKGERRGPSLSSLHSFTPAVRCWCF